MGYVVIGLPKCGTSSLVRYLKQKSEDTVTKIESIYDPAARMVYDTWHSGRQPHIVVRHMADRLWSGFNYFGYYKTMSFEKFLYNEDFIRQNLGFNIPIKMCNWTPFLEPFNDLNPTIHYLHELKQLDDFPKEKDQTEKKPDYSKIPDEYRFIVNDLLKDMGLNEYGMPPNYKKMAEDADLMFNKYL